MKTRPLYLAWLSLPFLSLCGAVSGHADVTGTWRATNSESGSSRIVMLQLHQRADGKVLGYIPGGTARSVVTAGSVSGDRVHLEMELEDPRATRISVLDGSARRNLIRGTVDDGSGPRSIALHRATGVFHERRFLFAKPSVGPGEPTGILDLSVVLDDRNRFVSGGFVSRTDCALFACGGVVTSFSEAGTAIAVGLESGGACPGSGSFTATFDGATRFYSGTYAFTSCAGTDSGTLLGAKGTRTRTDHVAGVLAALGRIADDLQARISFAAPYAPVSPHYFHSGKTLADLLAGFNAEVAAYDSIDVVLNRFRNIKTVDDPDTLPDVDTPIGVDFHDRRSGVPLGGGSAVTYRDADTGTGVPGDTELKYFAEEAGAWAVIGNGEIALPSLSYFQANRSDRFPVDIPFIDAGHPFKGRRALSPHQGAHVHWRNNGTNPWPRGGTAVSNYPAIYARETSSPTCIFPQGRKSEAMSTSTSSRRTRACSWLRLFSARHSWTAFLRGGTSLPMIPPGWLQLPCPPAWGTCSTRMKIPTGISPWTCSDKARIHPLPPAGALVVPVSPRAPMFRHSKFRRYFRFAFLLQ